MLTSYFKTTCCAACNLPFPSYYIGDEENENRSKWLRMEQFLNFNQDETIGVLTSSNLTFISLPMELPQRNRNGPYYLRIVDLLQLIKSLLEEGKMPSTPYVDLVGLVKNYYEPKPSVIEQRHKFNTRVRQQGESVATYVAALRELAEHCSYGTTLPEMLRDRLVCGFNHEAIQRKLLAEPYLRELLPA